MAPDNASRRLCHHCSMLRRPGSIKLLDLFGIRISVDAGWFLTLFLVILWLSPSFRTTLNSTDGVAYLTTVVSALLFFASLVVHELGHAVVARRNGIEVRNIQLFLFGGLTQMSREARTPGEEFRIAAAGPAATFLMVIVFLVVDLAIVGPQLLWDAIRLAPNVRITPVLLGLSWLLLMNVVVLLFNLVPAFPLDGGRIARALVWRTTGDKRRGTRAAAQLGQGFAVILAGIGIWMMLSGNALRRPVAGAAGVPARPVGPRRADADRVDRADRGRPGIGHHGSPAGGDPRRARPSPRRSTNTSFATAGPGSRSSTTAGGSWGSPARSGCRRPPTVARAG